MMVILYFEFSLGFSFAFLFPDTFFFSFPFCDLIHFGLSSPHSLLFNIIWILGIEIITNATFILFHSFDLFITNSLVQIRTKRKQQRWWSHIALTWTQISTRHIPHQQTKTHKSDKIQRFEEQTWPKNSMLLFVEMDFKKFQMLSHLIAVR